MALHMLRLSRACGSRGIFIHGQHFAAPAISHRQAKVQHVIPSVSLQTRSLSLPSWLSWAWPFGGDSPTLPTVAEVVPEAVAEPLEIVTGFSKDGAFVPVTADMADFSPVVQWTNDALMPSLQSLGLGSYYTPVGWLQHLFTYLTLDVSLPVFGSLFCIILLLRIPTIPFYIMAQKRMQDMLGVAEAQNQLKKEIQYYQSTGRYAEAQQAMARQRDLTFKSFKSMLPIIGQFPIVFLFVCLRKMCYADYALIANSGFLWMQTLTIPDPYYIMPVAAATMIMSLIAMNAEAGMSAVSASSNRVLLYVSVAFSGCFFAFQPAASVMVITMNSFVTFCINATLKMKPVRAALGLPEVVRRSQAAKKQEKAGEKRPSVSDLVQNPQKFAEKVSKMSISNIPMLADFMRDSKRRTASTDFNKKVKKSKEHYMDKISDARAGKITYYDNRPR